MMSVLQHTELYTIITIASDSQSQHQTDEVHVRYRNYISLCNLHYIKCLNLTMQAELMTACTYVACIVLHVHNLISITILPCDCTRW